MTIAATLRWTEPDDGKHTIILPDADEAEVRALAKYLKKTHGEDYGDTIASISIRRSTREPEAGAWEDLALNVRYTTGEELYGEDIAPFALRGIVRH